MDQQQSENEHGKYEDERGEEGRQGVGDIPAALPPLLWRYRESR
jgi:hypothetical protein